MIAFLREWGRVLLWGDSIRVKATKVLAIVAAVTAAWGLPKLLDESASIAIRIPKLGFGNRLDGTLGWFIFAVLGAAYAAWSGGMAWVRSGGSKLWVDDSLTEDSSKNQMLRLNVGNDGDGVVEPQGILEWVKGEDGTCYEPGIGSLELEWTTLPVGRPQLSRGDRWMLGVAYVRNDTLGFAIQGHRLETQPRDRVTCSIGCLSEAPGAKSGDSSGFGSMRLLRSDIDNRDSKV